MKDGGIVNLGTTFRLEKELASDSSPASGKIDVNPDPGGPGGGAGRGVEDPFLIHGEGLR